ncbi:MAG: hypothetical protein AAGA64_13825 [Bacteroidota bacterium]
MSTHTEHSANHEVYFFKGSGTWWMTLFITHIPAQDFTKLGGRVLIL